MSQYACTQCMHWFSFDQLSTDKQMCSDCTSSSTNKSKAIKRKRKSSKDNRRFKCKYCRTDLKFDTHVCERCRKNFKEHGKPKICIFCKLPSAFIGSKCQRCSSNQKKYGDPIKCQNCGMKSAFDHDKAKINDRVLCWRCCVKKQKEMLRAQRRSTSNRKYDTDEIQQKVMKYSPTRPYIDDRKDQTSDDDRQEVWKALLGEDKGSKVKALFPQSGKTNSLVEAKSNSLSEVSMKKKEDLRKKAHLNSQKYGSYNKNDRRSLEARLIGMKKTFSAPTSPAGLSPLLAHNKEQNRSNKDISKSDTQPSIPAKATNGKTNDKTDSNLNNINLFPTVNEHNIVVVTRLREEISGLKKQLAKKDQQLIDKDKQVSILKVEHLSEIKSLQTKLKNQEDDYIKTIENLRLKNQELLKKIAQISKGKA